MGSGSDRASASRGHNVLYGKVAPRPQGNNIIESLPNAMPDAPYGLKMIVEIEDPVKGLDIAEIDVDDVFCESVLGSERASNKMYNLARNNWEEPWLRAVLDIKANRDPVAKGIWDRSQDHESGYTCRLDPESGQAWCERHNIFPIPGK